MKNRTKKLFLLLFGFLLYLSLGALVFEAVENGKNTGDSKMTAIYNKLKSKNNLTRQEFDTFILEIQSVYQATNHGSKWTFYSSLYFCGSVVTTIGMFVNLTAWLIIEKSFPMRYHAIKNTKTGIHLFLNFA